MLFFGSEIPDKLQNNIIMTIIICYAIPLYHLILVRTFEVIFSGTQNGSKWFFVGYWSPI